MNTFFETRKFTSKWPGVSLQELELKSGSGYGEKFIILFKSS